MQVSAFINKLTNTTLRNLGITESVTSRQLNDEYREEILEYINSGLLELYNKYQLKVDALFLELQEGRTRYPITSEHVMDNWHEPDREKYIWKNVEESFTDDLVKILLIRDHSGIEVPLNDPNNVLSIYTPEYNVLEVSSHFPIQFLTIDYQARHKPVSQDTDEISLPDSLYDCLAFYVAAHACANMNSEGAITNANKYAQLYSNAIQSFDSLGTFEPKHTPIFKKFYLGGWV
jgi:hypothetical protein